MTPQSIGPLRARIVRKPGKSEAKRPALTVVLMHGFGAPGDDLAGLADMIDAPPASTFVFPEALHALSDFGDTPFFGDARCWWLIDFARLERSLRAGELRDLTGEVPEGLAPAREAVLAMIHELPKIDAGEHLVLGGFSQGAMLGLDVALRTDLRLEGVVQLSGTLLAEHEWVPLMPKREGLPVFQSHGTNDPILPFALAERLRDALGAAKLPTTFDRFVGPHTIPPATMKRLGEWLCALPAKTRTGAKDG